MNVLAGHDDPRVRQDWDGVMGEGYCMVDRMYANYEPEYRQAFQKATSMDLSSFWLCVCAHCVRCGALRCGLIVRACMI